MYIGSENTRYHPTDVFMFIPKGRKQYVILHYGYELCYLRAESTNGSFPRRDRYKTRKIDKKPNPQRLWIRIAYRKKQAFGSRIFVET